MVELSALRLIPLLVLPARVATGVSFAVPSIANWAEVEEFPPIAKS